MRTPIPDIIKQEVIAQWLRGHGRDEIAHDNNISEGATTNITNEWMKALGRPEAAELREFGKALRMADVTPAQCAVGFRAVNILKSHGMNAEEAEQFISATYKKCQARGVTPDKIATHIEDLLKFSDKARLPEIDNYLKQSSETISELEKREKELMDRVSNLEARESELKKSCDLTLEEKRNYGEEIDSFLASKEVLRTYKLSTDDFQGLAETVKGIAELGNNPKRVLAEFNDIQYQKDKGTTMKIATEEMEKNFARLERQYSSLQRAISSHLERIPIYNELEDMGFDLVKLKVVQDTVLGIASSNGISIWLAADKFMKDLTTRYSLKVGFDSEIEILETQIKRLDAKKERRQRGLDAQPLVNSAVTELFELDLSKEDILNMGLVYLKILNTSYTIGDLSKGMTNVIDMMRANATSSCQSGTTNNKTKLTDILNKVSEDLSQLRFAS